LPSAAENRNAQRTAAVEEKRRRRRLKNTASMKKERPMHKAKILYPAIRPDCGRRNDAIKKKRENGKYFSSFGQGVVSPTTTSILTWCTK
jgi:hypothetical protein